MRAASTGNITADGLRSCCKPSTLTTVADARDARRLWPGWPLRRDA